MRKGKDVHVYFPAGLYEKLKAAAKRERRSITMEVIIAIEDYLRSRQKNEK